MPCPPNTSSWAAFCQPMSGRHMSGQTSLLHCLHCTKLLQQCYTSTYTAILYCIHWYTILYTLLYVYIHRYSLLYTLVYYIHLIYTGSSALFLVVSQYKEAGSRLTTWQLHFTALCGTVLYGSVLHGTVLYSTVLYSISVFRLIWCTRSFHGLFNYGVEDFL